MLCGHSMGGRVAMRIAAIDAVESAAGAPRFLSACIIEDSLKPVARTPDPMARSTLASGPAVSVPLVGGAVDAQPRFLDDAALDAEDKAAELHSFAREDGLLQPHTSA